MASVETDTSSAPTDCERIWLKEISQIMNSTTWGSQNEKKDTDFEVSNISILMMTIAGLGFAINLVAAVFLSYKMKSNHSPFLRLLRALALSDLCVMVTGALLYGMPGLSGHYTNQVRPMIAPYLLPIAQTSIMTSVYLAVLMAFERYIRICFTCQLKITRIISDHKLRYYVWACIAFPILFYIPKWFEAQSLQDLPKACYRLKEASKGLSDCLVTVAGNATAVRDRRLNQVHGKITKLLSIYCWNANATVTEQNMSWMLRSTSLRTNVTYYISYYMTLNTLFATLLPIGALLFFSLSTIQGLNSIRKLFETSVPMRMSSSRLQQQSSKSNHEATSDPDNAEKVSLHSTRATRLSLSVSFKNNKSVNSIEGRDSLEILEDSRKSVAQPSSQEKRLTRISIAIAIIYILCHMWKLPPSIYEAWYFIRYGKFIDHPFWWDVVNNISTLLILANSAFNFIIYLLL